MITVLIPCYKHSHLISRAIESIRHQRDIHTIVLNDEPGCDLSWYENLSGVSVYQDGRHKGQSARKNEGIDRAILNNSMHVTFNDADDSSLPFRIEVLQNTAIGADIVYTDCITSKRGRLTGYITSRPFDIEALKNNNYIVGATAYISVGFLMRSGLQFREDLIYGEDWLFWHDAYKAGATFEYLPMPTINYNLDTSSVGIRHTDKWATEKVQLRHKIKEMY